MSQQKHFDTIRLAFWPAVILVISAPICIEFAELQLPYFFRSYYVQEFLWGIFGLATLFYTLSVYFVMLPGRKGGWAIKTRNHPLMGKLNEWTTIATVLDQATMVTARLALESRGIPCYVRNEGIQNLGFWAFLPDCEMDIQALALYAPEAQLALQEDMSEQEAEIAWQATDWSNELDEYEAGVWFYDFGDYERALEIFQVITQRKDPDLDGAYFNIACCHAQLGQLAEAREALKEAILLDSNSCSDALDEKDLAPLHDWLQENKSLCHHSHE